MTNQEALHIMCAYNSHTEEERLKASFVLQELIDNMKFIEEVQTPDYIRVQKLNEQLEKALDILSDLISKNGDCDYFPCPFAYKCYEEHNINCDNKEVWKEYAINKAKEELNGK